MSLSESLGGKLAFAVSQPAWVPSPSVLAIAVMMNYASVQITLVGPAWEENFQIRLDLAPCWLRDIVVADEDPNSWVASLVITLVLDGVGRVVCVYHPSAGSFRHVRLNLVVIQTRLRALTICFAGAMRCSPVRAKAIIFTEASWFREYFRALMFVPMGESKAFCTCLLKVISWTHLIPEFAKNGRIFMQVPPAHHVAKIEVNRRRIVAVIIIGTKECILIFL